MLRNLHPLRRHATHLFVLALIAAGALWGGIPGSLTRPPQSPQPPSGTALLDGIQPSSLVASLSSPDGVAGTRPGSPGTTGLPLASQSTKDAAAIERLAGASVAASDSASQLQRSEHEVVSNGIVAPAFGLTSPATASSAEGNATDSTRASAPSPTPAEAEEPVAEMPGALARLDLTSRGRARPRDEVGGAGESAPKREPLRPVQYRVVAGDTLQNLAERFGVSSESILWSNHLPGGGDLLQVGQSLTIPPVSGVLHTVREGDTVLGLAQTYEVDSQRIVEANALSDPFVLVVDQQIVIPGGRPLAPPPEPAVKHTVRPGETVATIAGTYGVEQATIIRANGLLNPDRLTIGQQLAVPGGKPPEEEPKNAAPAKPAETPPAQGQVKVAQVAPEPAPKPAEPVAKAPEPAKADPRAAEPAKPAPEPAKAPEPAQAPAPASTPSPPAEVKSGDQGQEIVNVAMKYNGYRYRWGGHSPGGFDCTGFTWYVYREAGINIPQHDLWGQLVAGTKVSRDALLPGDLVFFQNTYQRGLSHSGLYIGGGRFIHAVDEASGVTLSSLSEPYWASRWFGASRPW